MKVATIIVTFNRINLLTESIEAHLNQTRLSDLLLIVNNASTDDTKEYLDSLVSKYKTIKILNLNENLGGSGGFYYGLKYLKENTDIDWAWMMDDDAIPHQVALEKICNYAKNENIILGSLPQNNGRCSWANANSNGKLLINYDDYCDIEEVNWIPFLGFFINLGFVSRIGFPEKDFFLAADDVEYSMRAKKHGAKVFIVRDSLLNHPCADTYRLFIGYRYITNLRLAPWKRYYDTRNRLLVAKKYYGINFYLQTIPATFLRLFASILYESDRLKQVKAYALGFFDGLTNKTGKRHDRWGL